MTTKDQIAETISMYEGFQDGLAQLSAEVDELLEERSARPCLDDLLKAQVLLLYRYAFIEDAITRLLVGAPVLLGH